MARKTRMVGEAAGLYKHSNFWWLGYSYGGKRQRVNLWTSDLPEAIKLAGPLRGQAPKGALGEDWESEIARYLKEKQSHTPPSGFQGRRWVSMNSRTAKKTLSVLRVFASWSGTKGPNEVTHQRLKDYLKLRMTRKGKNPAVTRKGAPLKGSRAGALSTLSAIISFLRHTGNLPPGRLDLPPTSTLERRTLTFTPEEIDKLIREATEDNDRLALILGFRCGMREREIRHFSASWFLANRKILSIPDIDESTEFSSKDLTYREVPSFADDLPFIQRMCKERPVGPVLRKTKKKGSRPSKSGLYDFEGPLRKHVLSCGFTKFTLHSMRHSFATNRFACGKTKRGGSNDSSDRQNVYPNRTQRGGGAPQEIVHGFEPWVCLMGRQKRSNR